MTHETMSLTEGNLTEAKNNDIYSKQLQKAAKQGDA